MVRAVHQLTVNDESHEVEAEPDTPLLAVLRNHLGLLGSRFGCGQGLCGACFVIVDGTAVPSCTTPVWSVVGRAIVTIEGLGHSSALHPVQQAFLDEQAAQCAFCASGVVMSAVALLERNPRPSPTEVREALDRNLCRCGAQQRMVRAVTRAAELLE